jgi:hypothetical protein
MLIGKKEQIDIWRSVPATGISNWGDPTWEYHATVFGTVQPFDGITGNRNNQQFANIRHIIVVDSTTDIQKDDELVFKNIYERVDYVLPWESSIISHLEVHTTDTQWDRTAT